MTNAALFHRLTADPAFGDVRRVFIDSTIIRAHPHAAGARRRAKRIGAARSATAQGLGRSRGGFGTKVIVTAADEDTALAVDVVPGQAGDAPLLVPMLARTLRRVPVIDEIVGDIRPAGRRSPGTWCGSCWPGSARPAFRRACGTPATYPA